VIDQNEGHPYQFRGIKDRKQKEKTLVIPVAEKRLFAMSKREVTVKRGTFEIGLADYTIEGHEEEIQIERKSIMDLFGTFGGKRDRFEAEIKRLHEDCEVAAVVVEARWREILQWRGHGPSVASVQATILAWQQRYPGVHWCFWENRAICERMTFRFLERFWRDKHE
jgi:ERCC4-type nuclease